MQELLLNSSLIVNQYKVTKDLDSFEFQRSNGWPVKVEIAFDSWGSVILA